MRNCTDWKIVLMCAAMALAVIVFSGYTAAESVCVQPAAGSPQTVAVRADGITLALPGGWALEDRDKSNCIAWKNGLEICAWWRPALGLEACEWLKKDIESGYGDDASLIDLKSVPLTMDEYSPSGAASGCRARAISSKTGAMQYAAVLLFGDSALAIESSMAVWGKDLDASSINSFEGDFFSIIKPVKIGAACAIPAAADDVPEPPGGKDGRPDFRAIKEAAGQFAPVVRDKPLLSADWSRLRGYIEEARQKYEALRDIFPYDAQVGLGDTALMEQRFDKASAYYESATKIDPSRPDAYNGLGSVAFAKGNDEKASEKFNEALRKAPGSPDTLANLGWLMLDAGKKIEAETRFMEALARSPGPDAMVSATNGLTEIAFIYDEPEKAVAWNTALISALPELAEGHANLIRAFLAMKDPAHAAGEADILVKLAPERPGAMLLSGRAYAAAGRNEDTVKWLCPVVEKQMIPVASGDAALCAAARKAAKPEGNKTN